VRRANRIEYTLESRAKTMDVLLHEWKSDLLHIWIPMIAGASLLVGMFGGMEIQGCRDSALSVGTMPMPSATPTIPTPSPRPDGSGVENPNQQTGSRRKANASPHRER
jgi:hypothetical protein